MVVTEAARKRSPDFVYWSFIRYELRHNLRQSRADAYGEIAWKALRAAERTQARLRWHPELKCEPLLESAEELSGRRAMDYAAASADFLHVAAARRLTTLTVVDQFWTCDAEQAKLAEAVGLAVRLFQT